MNTVLDYVASGRPMNYKMYLLNENMQAYYSNDQFKNRKVSL